MPRAEGAGPHPTGAGGRHGQPVGTVAEEAARLVQSLSRWADGDEEQGGAPDGEQPPGPDGGQQPGPDADGTTAGCTCSCHRAGEAAACRLCPICQGIALLRSIRPETLERVADVAGMAATALHELAEQRRQAADEQQGDGASAEDPTARHEPGEEDPS